MQLRPHGTLVSPPMPGSPPPPGAVFSVCVCYAKSLVSVVCIFSLCHVHISASVSLCYVESSVCVMCSPQSDFCVAFSVSGSPRKRQVAALLIRADVYIYIHLYLVI